MKRLEALRVLEAHFADRPLIVTCGATARELAAVSRRPQHLPLLDSMGLTSAVGLGVALAHPGPVGVVDGDGSLLMGFSILATLRCYAPPNLTVVVLDNGQHASADGMPSQAAQVDIAAAAAGLGLATTVVSDLEGLADTLDTADAASDCQLVFARIEPGNAAGIGFRLDDPAVLADQFRLAVASLATAGVPDALPA